MYFLYILECRDASLYTGISTDVERRFDEHARGVGSRYTRSRGAKKIVYVEECVNRSVAQKREAFVKKMSRHDKLKLIATQSLRSVD